MSAQIISLAEFRTRREQAAAPDQADAVAAASRALTASIEIARRQALLLRRTRARHARCLHDVGE